MNSTYTLNSREVVPPKGFRVDTASGRMVAWNFSSLVRQTGLHPDEADAQCANLLAREGHLEWVTEHVPRLTDQGYGKVVDFSSEDFLPALYHYNPAICCYHDRVLLAYRRQGHKPGGYSDICICDLDPRTLAVVPGSNVLLDLPRQYPDEPDEHYEDPRLCVVDGQLWLTVGSWRGKWNYRPTQMFVQLTPALRVEKVFTPPLEGNGTTTTQKNWLLFDLKGAPAFIYSAAPHRIYSLDPATGTTTMIANHTWAPEGWPNGLRGGTNPILYKGAYWTFVRSHELCNGGGKGAYKGRRYTVGAYTFDPETLKVTGYSRRPFLRASEKDPGLSWAPLVAFASGAILWKDQFVVSLGVHDRHSALWYVDQERLLEGVQPV